MVSSLQAMLNAVLLMIYCSAARVSSENDGKFSQGKAVLESWASVTSEAAFRELHDSSADPTAFGNHGRSAAVSHSAQDLLSPNPELGSPRAMAQQNLESRSSKSEALHGHFVLFCGGIGLVGWAIYYNIKRALERRRARAVVMEVESHEFQSFQSDFES